jgi:hypothetical protein
MIPDVALLRIFDFYLEEGWRWHTLVHVCREWRSVVFGSPRRLNLQLRCTAKTPVRKTLDVWPLIPIAIRAFNCETWGLDNIIAALEHNNRICDMDLFTNPKISSSQLKLVLAAMQKPFPTLTRLHFHANEEIAPVDPHLFLGGSAPRLQTLILNRIPLAVPGLPKLLLTATHLVHLRLLSITQTGYISPEAMVTCLTVSTRLERLELRFNTPLRPNRRYRHPLPPTRALLPALTEFQFKGDVDYLEDFVVRIDAPVLDTLDITLFLQHIFQTPQLTQFISRTPKFKSHDEAEMIFSSWGARIKTSQTPNGAVMLSIPCGRTDLQLSSMAQFCSSIFPRALITTVEHLYILENKLLLRPHWQDNIENREWLELFRPFTAVKGLYISEEFLPRIAPTLKELVGERVTEVLPALLALFLEETNLSEPVREAIGEFIAARQLAGRRIDVSQWGGIR